MLDPYASADKRFGYFLPDVFFGRFKPLMSSVDEMENSALLNNDASLLVEVSWLFIVGVGRVQAFLVLNGLVVHGQGRTEPVAEASLLQCRQKPWRA